MIRADTHSHTVISHGSAPVAQMFAAARKNDLDFFGFSEHSPLPDGFSCRLYTGDLAGEFPAYAAQVLELKKSNHKKPEPLLGMELDWLPSRLGWMRKLAASQPFDYILGSLHYLDGYSVGNAQNWPATLPLLERFGRFEAYFQEMAGMAASGLAQIASHPDFIKLRTWPEFQQWINSAKSRDHVAFALETMAKHGMAMEVSSAGLRQAFREPYPCPAIMRLARDLNIQIVFGSDAHAPEDIASGFAYLADYAASFGFSHSLVFIGREPVRLTF